MSIDPALFSYLFGSIGDGTPYEADFEHSARRHVDVNDVEIAEDNHARFGSYCFLISTSLPPLFQFNK
jgi:hypothetical protein